MTPAKRSQPRTTELERYPKGPFSWEAADKAEALREQGKPVAAAQARF